MNTNQEPLFQSEHKFPADTVPTSIFKTVPYDTDAYQNEWDGDICDCGGRAGLCDSQAWTNVCLTVWCPCVVMGLNMRRAFMESAWAHAAAFFMIFIGAPITLVVILYLYVYPSAGPMIDQAVADDSLDELNAAVNYTHRMEDIFHYVACTCAIIGTVYGFAMRMRIIKKYHIREDVRRAFCFWCWCTPCALCQERRTLLTHVDKHTGVWSDHPSTVQPIQATQLAVTSPPVHANMNHYCPV